MSAGDHALLIGLTASVLIHLLIALLNPKLTREAAAASGAQARAERGQLIELVITESPREQPVGPETPPVSSRAVTSAARAATSAGDPGSSAAVVPNAAAAALETALRYRASPLWALPPPKIETCAQRVRRERTERLAQGIADKTVGVVPPAAAPTKQRFEGGIRIPIGPKPPGPAQVVPAPPLPDSFPSVLQPPRDTVNPRLSVADSLRCAAQDRIEALLRARPDTLR